MKLWSGRSRLREIYPLETHSEVIDPRKQILIYLWCMANQESTRVVADRFNVTFSSVTRVMHWVTKSLLSERNQYIKWPTGNILSFSVLSFNLPTFSLLELYGV